MAKHEKKGGEMARKEHEPTKLTHKGGMKKGGGFMTTPMNKNLAK